MEKKLTISKLAQQADVNIETIRYYQRRGLLETPVKNVGTVRRYPQETVARIRFIKRTQALGFTLDEIVDLLRFDGVCVCTETRTRLQGQVELVERKIADLQAMRRALDILTGPIDGFATLEGCPLVKALGR
ncbi:Mercuric resistance operon regulatory protein [Serratia quinivorans]|uniref:MerR family transcriptional regulator n=1 Tax=Serratia quinivorans TaxID=137545 RepID=UPI000D92AFE8|nr:MerR family transcriptional regulator [Serratia quinivorans]SPZ60708.1 Mercuric resistance operon regulatory protein [Serratia quinivorans]VEI65706.1 Mercuric resistance operon regulatory protein [Serratia quinivorans]